MQGVQCLFACKEDFGSYSQRGVYGSLFSLSQCFALVLITRNKSINDGPLMTP